MSETRKNHLTIDGGQVKEDDHVASYKPIPETDFRTSKTSLHKSKEKLSPDGAEERLLKKEEEAKITTRVDMADAKYVVGDHRNGDAKIELDANKRQFAGLTKEELMKYAEDPFWVRLRWFMFVLFWAMWLCMLAGAIAIIVRAPKCAPPAPKTWYEKGPLVDMSTVEDLREVSAELESLDSSPVAGIFAYACKNSYDVLKEPTCLDQFKELLVKTKKAGIKVIVDLTANFVETTHEWFQLSQNSSAPYKDYFIWAQSTNFNSKTDERTPPNNWISLLDEPMWTFNEVRNEYYLHHFGTDQPDLNFNNPDVVKEFDNVIKAWMKAGADGIRLLKARELLVDPSKENNPEVSSPTGAVHTQYAFYKPKYTSDQPGLDDLFAHWSNITASETGEAVFTIAEDGSRPELFLLDRNTSYLRPPQARPVSMQDPSKAVKMLNSTITKDRWPAVQLIDEGEVDGELAAFAMLLPATPILDIKQLAKEDNETTSGESLSHAISLRNEGSIQHGSHYIEVVPVHNSTDLMIACARLKKGQTGYVGVYNPHEVAGHANLTLLSQLPDGLAVHRVSREVHLLTNYTTNLGVKTEDILVPAKSSVILSFVPPKDDAEK